MPSLEPHQPHVTGHQAFSDVLSEAIARRNLTLERLSKQLRAAGTPVSIATLSYWQTGRSLPTRNRSIQAVEELEKVLRVPVGHLTSALPGDAVSRWDPIGQLPRGDRTSAVLRSLGLSPEQNYTNLTLQDSIVVSAGHAEQWETTRQLLQADEDGMDRLPLVFRQEDQQDVAPSIEPGTGCELGRVVQLEEEGLVAAELLLPHPLRRGELAMLDYHLTWDISQGSDDGFARVLPRALSYLVLDVRFEGQLPTSVGYYTAPGNIEADDERTKHQPLPVQPFVQFALTDPSPGTHGLEWQF